MIRKTILTNNNPMNIDSSMKDSYTIAGMQDNNCVSKFHLDKNYENINNTFSIPSYNIGVHDSHSHSHSSSSEIDEYASDIEDNHDNID